MNQATLICHICSGILRDIPIERSFKMVSSDCRPWPGALRLSVCCACGALQKPVTQEWLQDIERLYMGYQVYTQANGKEQQVAFDSKSGLGVARSAKIADWFMAREGLPVSGKLLDVGCGNGSFLRAFRNTIQI